MGNHVCEKFRDSSDQKENELYGNAGGHTTVSSLILKEVWQKISARHFIKRLMSEKAQIFLSSSTEKLRQTNFDIRKINKYKHKMHTNTNYTSKRLEEDERGSI